MANRADPVPDSPGPAHKIRLHKGWHVVADDPPGTLRWWNGQAYVARAFWVVDHWDYESDDRVGHVSSPSSLPDGVLEVRETGWWAPPPRGRWHAGWELPLPQRPTTDSFLKVGVAGVVVASAVWMSWLLVLINPDAFLGLALYVIPFGTLASFPLGLIARRDPAREGKRVTRLGGLVLAMSIASMGAAAMVVFAALLNSAGQM